jgi:hypothetical protein
VTETRDDDGSCVSGTSEVSDSIEALASMARGRTVAEEDCKGWRSRGGGLSSVGVGRGDGGLDEIGECLLRDPDGATAIGTDG